MIGACMATFWWGFVAGGCAMLVVILLVWLDDPS